MKNLLLLLAAAWGVSAAAPARANDAPREAETEAARDADPPAARAKDPAATARPAGRGDAKAGGTGATAKGDAAKGDAAKAPAGGGAGRITNRQRVGVTDMPEAVRGAVLRQIRGATGPEFHRLWRSGDDLFSVRYTNRAGQRMEARFEINGDLAGDVLPVKDEQPDAGAKGEAGAKAGGTPGPAGGAKRGSDTPARGNTGSKKAGPPVRDTGAPAGGPAASKGKGGKAGKADAAERPAPHKPAKKTRESAPTEGGSAER